MAGYEISNKPIKYLKVNEANESGYDLSDLQKLDFIQRIVKRKFMKNS